MNTSFIINGGAGRVITAIPALEKFARLNPNDDFKVFVYGWESLYWSHPLLQKRTFSIGQKGVFNTYIRDSNLIVPEPYDRRSYYTQQKSLAEVFDEEINQTNDHSDLTKPNLYLQRAEIFAVQSHLQKQKEEKKKDKVIVFQPYGSGIGMNNGRPFDGTIRSLDVDDYLYMARKLSEHSVVVFFGPKEYIHPADDFTFQPSKDLNPDLRFWMSCISQCDYFVGCDSVGQHMARAFDKRGTVIMGSTFENNVSYPGYFDFVRNGIQPTYSPIRIGGVDCEFADRANDQCMTFSQNQLDQITNNVLGKLNPECIPCEPKWKW